MGSAWGNWLELAREELRQSKEALTVGVYLSVVFSAHQVAEHSLKALYIARADALPPRTHELVSLAEALEAPASILHECRVLTPLYMTSRYPDAANGNPVAIFDSQLAADYLARAERVLQWCSDLLAN